MTPTHSSEMTAAKVLARLSAAGEETTASSLECSVPDLRLTLAFWSSIRRLAYTAWRQIWQEHPAGRGLSSR